MLTKQKESNSESDDSEDKRIGKFQSANERLEIITNMTITEIRGTVVTCNSSENSESELRETGHTDYNPSVLNTGSSNQAIM